LLPFPLHVFAWSRATGPDANRRAALGRRHQRLIPGGRTLLKPHHQAIIRRQFIDAAATSRTVAKVGGNLGKFRLAELAQ